VARGGSGATAPPLAARRYTAHNFQYTIHIILIHSTSSICRWSSPTTLGNVREYKRVFSGLTIVGLSRVLERKERFEERNTLSVNVGKSTGLVTWTRISCYRSTCIRLRHHSGSTLGYTHSRFEHTTISTSISIPAHTNPTSNTIEYVYR